MRKNNQILHAFMILTFAWLGLITITLVGTFALGTVQTADAEELNRDNNITEEIQEEEVIIEKEPVYFTKKVQVKTNVNALNIRQEMSTDSNIEGVIYPNEIFEVEMIFKDNEIDTTCEWYKIAGSKYFVSSKFVNIVEVPFDLSKYIKTSKHTYVKELPKPKPVLSRDITVKSNLTKKDMDKILKGTGLEGQSNAILKVENDYGINAFFTYAVAALESSYGKSHMARTKNNIFGMNAVDVNPDLAFQYDSKHSSILDFGDRINKYYVKNGRTTLSSINSKYSSDDGWKNKVYDIMQSGMNKLNK